jgi:hypothetical protein
MAAPVVAGAAASTIAANRQMDPSPSDVRNALIGLGSTKQDECDGNDHVYISQMIKITSQSRYFTRQT